MITLLKNAPMQTWEELVSCKCPPPRRAGMHWDPLPHQDLISKVEHQMQRHSYAFDHRVFHLAHDGADMAVSWDLHGLKMPLPEGFTASVGVVNSNAQHFPLQLFSGVRLPSGAGMPLSRISLGKHTTRNLDQKLEARLYWALKNWWSVFKFDHKIKVAQKIKMPSNNMLEFLLAESARRDLMPWSRVGLIDLLLHKEDKQLTYWDLLKAFCEIAVLNPPLKQMPQCWEFQKLLDISDRETQGQKTRIARMGRKPGARKEVVKQ